MALNDYKIPEVIVAKTAAADVAIYPMFEDTKLVPELEEVDKQMKGYISNLVQKKKLEGKLKTYKLITTPDLATKSILIAGVGKKESYKTQDIYTICSNAARIIRDTDNETITIWPKHLAQNGITEQASAYAITKSMALGLYNYSQKAKDNKTRGITRINLVTEDLAGIKQVAGKAAEIAGATIYARDLVNTGSSTINPDYLVEEAKKLAGKNLKVEIMNESQLKKKGFNGILAVGNAANSRPALIIIQYMPSQKPKLALVGKGVTFDSGGLNIKLTGYIEDMKMDMSGAAAILSAMKHLSVAKPNFGIIAVLPVCENMISGGSYRPGDVIKLYNGKTIEVNNTDAEGRIILADALSYVAEQKPEAIIDLATLTGAMTVALGYSTAGIFTNNKKLAEKIKKAAEDSNEPVWEMPIIQEHRDSMEGTIADLRNQSKDKGAAGSATAAAFLENFVNNTPWVHIDIAGTAWRPETRDHTVQFATGYGTDLLLNLIEDYGKTK